MKVEIEFTKKYATKNKGDVFKYASMLASYLINVKKVAKKVTEKDKK